MTLRDNRTNWHLPIRTGWEKDRVFQGGKEYHEAWRWDNQFHYY